MTVQNDSIEMLNNCKLPLMSFSFINLFGATSVGKTYLMNEICNAYVDQANKTKYDLNNPYILNGPIDFIYFVSPSIMSDQTLRKNINDKILIEGTKENILQLCDQIFEMRNDIYQIIEIQQEIRKVFQSNNLQKLIQQMIKEEISISDLSMSNLNRESIDMLKHISNSIRLIEKMKMKYPQLKVQETNNEVSKYILQFLQLIGLNTFGQKTYSFLKRPKIILMIDDCSGSSLFQQISENNFYRLCAQRRHLSIWSLMMCLHGLTVCYGYFRSLQTGFVLFSGLKQEQVKNNFLDIARLQSKNFGEEQFLELYHEAIGFNEDNFSKRQKYIHNFLYLIVQPIVAIYENFEKQIK